MVFGVYQSIKTRSDYPCLITSVPKDYRKIGNGYIFQKDWPYKDLINFHLLKMYEEGIVNSLSQKWTRENRESSCAALVSNPEFWLIGISYVELSFCFRPEVQNVLI